jgi:metacaspase-1
MKKALCIGINNYPGTVNDLNGCVNDANDWLARLKSFGFETKLILDAQATRSTITSEFEALITQAQAGDVVVFTYSGHGTSVKDTSGDEPDGYDEALYVYDGVFLDDQLREILQKTKAGVHVVVIPDSCFSGTVTRVAALSVDTRIRYVRTDDLPANPRRIKGFLSEEDMVEILISGCSDKEYSYDAYINGRYNGAFTANALKVLKAGQTYKEFYTELRKILPSGEYPQTPQLEGPEKMKTSVLFEPSGSTPEPEPNPEPNPEPEPTPSWISKYWWVLAVVAAVGGLLYWIFK